MLERGGREIWLYMYLWGGSFRPLWYASRPLRLTGAYTLSPPRFWSVLFVYAVEFAVPFVLFARCDYSLGGMQSGL
jgi:hypothetical protein